MAEWLASPGAQALLGVGPSVAQLTSGGTFNVTIVAPALDVAEVVWDALGKAVQENGPMPPHWQMSAG